MKFIGQNTIITELNYLLEDVKKGKNYNILFRAPSGFGKTSLGLYCINILGLNDSYYYLPNQDGEINVDAIKDKRFHFIDEVHILKTPELIYPYMDSSDYTFIFASNESGMLKEPLINRCIPFIFEPYTDEDLFFITRQYLQRNLPDDFILEISRRCKRNPRIINVTCKRINYILNNYKVGSNDEYLYILDNILKIKSGGINTHDEIYLDFLRRAGGRASLNTISSGTGFDKELILSEIEPGLIYLNLIKITSKGRELLNVTNN